MTDSSLITVITRRPGRGWLGAIRSGEVVRYLSWKLASKRRLGVIGRGRVISRARFTIAVPRSRNVRAEISSGFYPRCLPWAASEDL